MFCAPFATFRGSGPSSGLLQKSLLDLICGVKIELMGMDRDPYPVPALSPRQSRNVTRRRKRPIPWYAQWDCAMSHIACTLISSQAPFRVRIESPGNP